MKTIKNISIKAAVLVAFGLCAFLPGKAQVLSNSYFNVDWQFNVPVGESFAAKASGWGMNFEGGYYLGYSDFALGGFLAYHTNNEYISARTLSVGQNGSLYTDQQHSVFRLPFGVSGRYRLTEGSGMFDPYLSLKLGAQFSRFRSYYSAYETYDNTWGFYLSPEIGTAIWPSSTHYFGFHVAAYFDYGTNQTEMLGYSIRDLSNFGIRVGVQF